MTDKHPSYLTFKQFAKKHQAWSETALRWIRFHEETNGFKGVFYKAGGRRLVIDEDKFFDRIREINGERPVSKMAPGKRSQKRSRI